MKTLHQGKLYLLQNVLWSTINLKKIGCSINPEIRKKPLSSALPDEIEIIHQSSVLTDKYFYEHMLSKLLFKYRYKTNREFYQIELEDYISIIKSIETINKLYNNEETLLEFIKNYDPDYYKKRFNSIQTIITNNKYNYSISKKKKQKLFVDTSCL